MKSDAKVNQDYQQSISIVATKEKAFQALTHNLEAWWGKVDQQTQGVGDRFKVSWEEPWYQFKVIDYQPFTNVTWKCIDANQIIDGLEGVAKEWINTQLIWTIQNENEQTIKVNLLHQGLNPTFICYDFCSKTWDYFITERLKAYLERENKKPPLL